MSNPSHSIFIGTSSKGAGANRGIYGVSLDASTGALSGPELAGAAPDPAFLAWHPHRKILYASGETVPATPGATAGAVNAYALNDENRTLTLLGAHPTGGLAVTHLAVDATGRMLITVSYHGGQIAAFPLGDDGAPGACSMLIQTSGQLGPNQARQDKPHPHSVTISPDNRHAYVCHLGLDRIFCFGLDLAGAKLTPAGEFAAKPGAGPRHSKFSADGRFFYVSNELDSTTAVYSCDPATGALKSRQIVSTLPADFTGTNTPAEIQVAPGGRFVYVSNRGHESLAIFARDAVDGTLARPMAVPCGGRNPRNFALSADGAWLVCANLGTNSLESFRVDSGSGQLTASGQLPDVPWPTCVLFAPA